MPHLRTTLALLLIFLLPAFAAWAGGDRPARPPLPEGVAVGQVAPDFTLQDVDGRAYTLSELRGKVVVVNFWATWCPPCRAEMPSMEQLQAMMPEEEFVILAVNVEEDALEIVREYLEENPHNFPVLLDDDGSVHEAYGVFRFPESFIVRRDGIVAEHVVGAIDWTSSRIVNLVNFLIKG